MRKQDRIANEQQDRPQRPSDQAPKPDQMQGEQMKGSASESELRRPPRQPGKLPLPD
jgi:hypothetical protein